jgi:hypothetical protein
MIERAGKYTDLEFEVIGLVIVLDSIDSMINREVLEFADSVECSEVMFPTIVHQKYFYIILADFLSESTDASLARERISCLGLLDKVINDPHFNENDSVCLLRNASSIFKNWLRNEIVRTIWIAGLNKEITVPLSRHEVISIAGNISKHHFGHLTYVLRKLNAILGDTSTTSHNSIIAINDLYSDLHDNVLNYHGSAIAEMLNEIRWGIHEYLLPEFRRAYRKSSDTLYDYAVPEAIKSKLTTMCYWKLMNSVRSGPYVARFDANKFLKIRY